MKVAKFYENIATLTEQQQIKSDCGDFTVINVGTETCYINGVALLQNQQYVAYANEYEINTSLYNLSFANTGGTRIVQVIRKIFTYAE